MGAYGNVSTLSHGIGISLSRDDLGAIGTKENQLSRILEQSLSQIATLSPLNAENIASKLRAIPELTKNREDTNAITQFAQKLATILKSIDFSSLPPMHQQYVLAGIKRSFLQEWKLQATQAVVDKGWNLRSGSIGLQFIAGFLPLPTIGL